MAKPQNVSSIPLSLANWFRGHWRSPTKETPVLHLLVGSLEDWWFLMHFLELGNGQEEILGGLVVPDALSGVR